MVLSFYSPILILPGFFYSSLGYWPWWNVLVLGAPDGFNWVQCQWHDGAPWVASSDKPLAIPKLAWMSIKFFFSGEMCFNWETKHNVVNILIPMWTG